MQPNLESYGCFIKFLLEKGLLDINGYVPLITNDDLPLMMGGHNWAKPSLFIKEDLYLLDFAENNPRLFLSLLQQGATNITYEQSCCFPQSNISNIIERLFKLCITKDEYFSIKSFIKNKQEYLKDYYNSSGNYSLLLCEYQCLIRLNDMFLFKSFCKKHLDAIANFLSVRNPFTGEVPKDTDSVNHISEIMAKYITENILPAIERSINLQRNNKYNNGIWGYKAITGAPITEGQLKDIDSQRWW